MLILQGGNALSDFRVNKLLSALQTLISEISTVQAYFIHFAETNADLDEKEQAQLDALLNYGEAINVADSNAAKLIVIPRPGTISPWSSKATDIVHNSGLKKVSRIERGMVYLFSLSDGSNLTDEQVEQIKPLIHDRMTDVVIQEEQDANALFSTAEPTQLEHVDILAGGKPALEKANSEMGLALSAEEIDYCRR